MARRATSSSCPDRASPTDDLSADTIRVDLQAGSYVVTLEPGWYLERSRPGGTFVRVEATLLSSASQAVAILANQTTNLVYRFAFDGGTIEMIGDLVIGIDVEEPSCDGNGMYLPACGTGPFLRGKAGLFEGPSVGNAVLIMEFRTTMERYAEIRC